jgi:hypothetical protein
MCQRFVILGVMGPILLSAGIAAPAPVSSFVFSEANYSVMPGAKVNIAVYWQQTVTGDDASVLDPSSEIGVFGQGVRIRWDNPDVPSEPAMVLSADDIIANSAFNDAGMTTPKTVTESCAQLQEATDFSAFVYGSEVSPGVWRQWIGTFVFTAGSASGEVTHLLAVKYAAPGSEGVYVIDGAGEAYDNVTAAATATITTVPEPSSIVLGGVAALTLWLFRRRDRKKGNADQCAAWVVRSRRTLEGKQVHP